MKVLIFIKRNLQEIYKIVMFDKRVATLIHKNCEI